MFPVSVCLAAFRLLTEMLAMEEKTQVAGVTFIVHLEGFSRKHLVAFSKVRVMKWITESLQVRVVSQLCSILLH